MAGDIGWMRIRSKELKRFLPGVLTSLLLIITTVLLLYLSMDDNHHPIARIDTSSNSVEVGQPVLLDGTDSMDPDGDDLSFLWTINDTMFNREPVFLYSFPESGTFTVVLMVEDSSGSTDTETLFIEVSPSE
jgi:hypothetical protein